MGIIVKKFGGATLADPQKVRAIAYRIAHERKSGDQIVVVVSAMGKSTDILLNQINELSKNPEPREVDLLLSTGELASAALLSIALNDQGCKAHSLSGAQAGILTDASHSSATIQSIDGSRIEEVLNQNNVAILAGFQGVTSQGDVTTLGRGGSDTTAVAIAARLRAKRCEILKDVPAVFTADPRVVSDALPISNLSYDALLEMTYWGAKVLQYRSVEIAKNFSVPLYVGPAHFKEQGTIVEDKPMIEDAEILALNSHERVLQVHAKQSSLSEALTWLHQFLDEKKISFPQVVHSEKAINGIDLFMTGPNENMEAISREISSSPGLEADELCTVTATCRGATRPELLERLVGTLEKTGINVLNMLVSSMSVTVFVESHLRQKAIRSLHPMIVPSAVWPQSVGMR